MGCCKCEEYRWVDPQNVVYTDSEGKGYCLFHAPADKKNIGGRAISVEDFNGKVLERIQAAIDSKYDYYVQFDGAIFPGEIFFPLDKGEPILPKLSFSFATFNGDANFISTTFRDQVDFASATFRGDAVFSSTTFNDFADFSSAKFFGEANFLFSSFNEFVSFSSATFFSLADFASVTFMESVEFSFAMFNNQVDFQQVSFKGDTHFNSATFRGVTSFILASFNKTFFRQTTCTDQLKFSYCQIAPQGLQFLDTDLYRHYFSRQDMANIHFINSCWPIEEGRYRIHAEDDRTPHWQDIRDFYQRMKRKCKNEHNEYEASEWHIAEKEAQIKLFKDETVPLRKIVQVSCLEKRLPDFHEISKRVLYHGLRSYKWLSGFGEKPFQALLWLVAFVFLPLMPFIFPGDMRCYIPLTKLGPTEGQCAITHLWMITWQLLITIQAALFAFALRNRFRR